MDPRIEKIIRLSPVLKSAILLLVALLISASFFFLMYEPKQLELSNLFKDTKDLEVKLKRDRKIARDLPRFKAEYDNLNQKLDRALTELPNEREIPGLLTSLSTLAKNQGLDILSFTPKAEVDKGFYAEVPVAMKLSGSFHEVAYFFDSVGQLPRIINIGNVLLDKPRYADGRTALSISFLATTYRFVEKPITKKKKKKKKR